LALFAAACGGGGGGGGGATGAQKGVPKDNGKPVEGGSLTYGLEADTLGGFCPPTAQLAAGGIQVFQALYDTLTVPNDKGEYVPYLAKSVTPNADFTQWTIVVRDGVTFHNGSPLNADAVKLNLDQFRKGVLFQFVFPDVSDVSVVDP
jgi:peptide/nickel transport system substrate-binding protein